jgi:hypothetical protein
MYTYGYGFVYLNIYYNYILYIYIYENLNYPAGRIYFTNSKLYLNGMKYDIIIINVFLTIN